MIPNDLKYTKSHEWVGEVDPEAGVDSVKAVSDMLSPMAGEVVEVNDLAKSTR